MLMVITHGFNETFGKHLWTSSIYFSKIFSIVQEHQNHHTEAATGGVL